MEKKRNIKYFERPEKRVPQAKPIPKDLMEMAQDRIKSYFQTLQKLSKEKIEERKRQEKINRDRELQGIWEETRLKKQEEMRKKVSALAPMGGYASDHRSESLPQMEEKLNPKEEHRGNWMKTDSYGQLLGDSTEEEFSRPRAVWRIYGIKRGR